MLALDIGGTVLWVIVAKWLNAGAAHLANIPSRTVGDRLAHASRPAEENPSPHELFPAFLANVVGGSAGGHRSLLLW